MTVVTDRFQVLARAIMQGLGMPGLPIAIVPHPIGGLSDEEVRQKADSVFEEVIARLTAGS